MKSIFLQPALIKQVEDHHQSICDQITALSWQANEPVCLYDLMVDTGRVKRDGEWLRLQEHWAEALANNEPNTIPYELFYGGEANIKKGLFPFLHAMRSRTLWNTITSPNPEPAHLIDLTRFTVYWAVFLHIKYFWIYKSVTDNWPLADYVGFPAMTSPVNHISTVLFGDKIKGSVMQAKTIHTQIATSIDRSEIWVNSALHILGTR